MMQCKHYISMFRIFDISKIVKSWYQSKRITRSSNYGSRASPKRYKFDYCLDDEDNFDIFDMNNNNEIE